MWFYFTPEPSNSLVNLLVNTKIGQKGFSNDFDRYRIRPKRPRTRAPISIQIFGRSSKNTIRLFRQYGYFKWSSMIRTRQSKICFRILAITLPEVRIHTELFKSPRGLGNPKTRIQAFLQSLFFSMTHLLYLVFKTTIMFMLILSLYFFNHFLIVQNYDIQILIVEFRILSFKPFVLKIQSIMS